MATRSHIGKKLEDGTIKYIYCHFDGYPSHNGRILKEHYRDSTKLDKLLELGDLSYLAPEIGKKQDFDKPIDKKWCLAYGRDRGEKGTRPKNTTNFKKFCDQDYNYLFENEGWHCYTLSLLEPVEVLMGQVG